MAKVIKSLLQSLYPYGVFRADRVLSSSNPSPVAYLTFDDGPIPEVTPQVLAILAKYNVKATFFMVGENIDKHPDVFRQVIEAGHSIGNHTYNHLKGWRTPYDEYMANTAKWENAFNRQFYTIVNQSSNRQSSNRQLFRPPYGKATFRQRRALHQQGYRLIYWDILTRDYEATRTPEQMLAQIKRDLRPGSIINFHDSLKSNERMLAVLPPALDYLLSQGYTLLSL